MELHPEIMTFTRLGRLDFRWARPNDGGVGDSLLLDMVPEDRSDPRVLRLTFQGVRSLAVGEVDRGIWLGLGVDDVSDRQWEGVNFSVYDYENDVVTFLCREFAADLVTRDAPGGYWSVDILGLTEHEADSVVAFAERRLFRDAAAVDPARMYSRHFDHSSVEILAAALRRHLQVGVPHPPAPGLLADMTAWLGRSNLGDDTGQDPARLT